jgi:hypothetical protein
MESYRVSAHWRPRFRYAWTLSHITTGFWGGGNPTTLYASFEEARRANPDLQLSVRNSPARIDPPSRKLVGIPPKSTPVEKLKSGHGGARPGAGKPKGTLAPQTLEKREMQRQFRERVTQQFAPLMDALIEKAVGVHHMMARGKDGKWIRSPTRR